MSAGTDKVTVRVSGLHASADTGEQEEVTGGYPGNCRRINDAWYVQYQEPGTAESAPAAVLLKIQPEQLEITRKGETGTHLILRQGMTTEGEYRSPYGILPLTVSCASVRILQVRSADYGIRNREEADHGNRVPEMDVRAEYTLRMDEEILSKARLHIRIRPETGTQE